MCLTLLSLHTITVLPLTTVYIVSEVHCTLNILHSLHFSNIHCTNEFTHYTSTAKIKLLIYWLVQLQGIAEIVI